MKTIKKIWLNRKNKSKKSLKNSYIFIKQIELKLIYRKMPKPLILEYFDFDDIKRLFWLKYEKEWPELAAYTKAILTVSASSAAVESF